MNNYLIVKLLNHYLKINQIKNLNQGLGLETHLNPYHIN